MDNKIKDADNKVVSFRLGEKTGLWLSDVNKYIVSEPPFDKIIELVYKGMNPEQIHGYCYANFGLSAGETDQIIDTIQLSVGEIQVSENVFRNKILSKSATIPENFYNKRYYQINGISFLFEFETREIEFLIHPKIAHLGIPEPLHVENHFQLFKAGSGLQLIVNGLTIGNWPIEMEHFFTGKVSMEILQKIYGNEEKDWMAVFHASAITNGKECILFLGDSGNGKSTTAAVLMASGFHLVADDFVPVDAKSGNVFSFPAALSIKKKAIDLLVHAHPQLASAKEYYYTGLDKTVRYLPALPSEDNMASSYPCNTLIFVKYKKDAGFNMEGISKDLAFQQLIPDSWISPLPENASFFIEWFNKMSCYQITYSDNDLMVNTVKKLFQNES